MSERFIGTWKLVSFEMRSDNQVTYPLGKDPVGYLIYSHEGYMAASLMASKRQRFSSVDILKATTEEIIAAYGTYVAYCGKYEVTEDKVTHLVEVSLFPNWVGGKQERFYKLEGDELILSTPPMIVGGKQQISYARAKKMK